MIDYGAFSSQRTGRIKKAALKTLWFWPRLYEAEQWRDGAAGGHRNPEDFVAIDPAGEKLVEAVATNITNPESAILDLGCNCGRHLHVLHLKGCTNLHGVDISQAALDHMDVCFPELKTHLTVTCATFQEFLSQAPPDAYDTVFTHGATVELIHPSYPLVREITRVTRNAVVLVIAENLHGYPRFWEREFLRCGFLLTKLERPVVEGHICSLMVFKKMVI